MINEEEAEKIRARIQEIQNEHAELDARIVKLMKNPLMDQLELQRLKKQKLKLKETLIKLEEMLIPDIPA